MPVGDASQAFQRKAERYYAEIGSRQAALRKRARWSAKAAHYLRHTNLQAGKHYSLVRVDPSYKEAIFRQLERVYPVTAAAMERHLAPLAQRAFDKWPVFTGLSKSLIDLRYVVRDMEFRGEVSCFAPYAIFIHRGAMWQNLIRKPGKEAADRIAADIARGISQ